MANASRVTVTGPMRTPNRFGLFSVVPIEDITDPHAMFGGVQWEPLTCARPRVLSNSCDCPPLKGFEPPPAIQDATPITVMGSWSCSLVGYTVEEAARRARQHLELGEQHAVERALWTGEGENGPRLAHPDTANLGEVRCVTDLLSVLEAYANTHQVGQSVLHAPRAVLPYLADRNVLVQVAGGARLETVYGLPIAAGEGYTGANTGPDGTPAPAGSWWVYMTGAMKIWRGEIVTPPDPEAGFSRCNNEMVALAERQFLVGWDCFTAGVLFTPCCECGPPTPPPAPDAGPAGEGTTGDDTP
jgi:hypothetical protein